ncbi:hypothetical protein ACFL2D_01890 [Patescibacteria group bacterium]
MRIKKALQFISGSALALSCALSAKAGLALVTTDAETAVGGAIPTENNVTAAVTSVIGWVLGVTFAIAVLVLIIGGFRYITSAGNDKQVQAAKTTMTYAIVGLVIVLLAYVIAATINAVIGAGA